MSAFSERTMITDPDRFFGRKRQINQILNALSSPQPQNISIIGERRIGRSSLLQHILHIAPMRLPNPERYQFAYLDVSRDTIVSPQTFYAEAAQALSGTRIDSLTSQQFDDILRSNNQDGTRRFVFLLDEFNVLQRRKDTFNDDFYDGLRSRANAGELTWVLASHVPLDEIAIKNDFTSTFFGIFRRVELGMLTRDEAKASFERPATPQLRAEQFLTVERWLESQYHPLKLNIAAELMQGASSTISDDVLKQQWDEEVDHVFGTRVQEGRRQRDRKKERSKQWTDAKGKLDYWTGKKPWMLILLVAVLLMLITGLVNWDQISAAVQGAAGIPTLTPMPTLTPVATPLP